MIFDLDPKTSQGLRFASQITGPDPSIFYIPSEEAVVTPITNEKKHVLMLKQGANSTNKNSNIESKLLRNGEFIWFLSDCVMSVLSGVVPVNKKELKNLKKLRVNF